MTMGIYDPHTGLWIRDTNPHEELDAIEREISMRELGAHPRLFPGDSVAELRTRTELWKTMLSAAIATTDLDHQIQATAQFWADDPKNFGR